MVARVHSPRAGVSWQLHVLDEKNAARVPMEVQASGLRQAYGHPPIDGYV